jgi:hypothetical protein
MGETSGDASDATDPESTLDATGGGMKQAALVDQEDTRVGGSASLVEQRATAPAVIPDPNVTMFERLARDQSVDVDKLERLMAMQERIMAINRKAAFDAAYARMQPEIPVIDEHGRIEVQQKVRSTYAYLEDIHTVIKPICAQHGFAMRHRTEWPEDRKGIIRIVGILSHEQGHSEESVFEAPMDRSDYRTDIQSMGSTVSYGRRYTTMDLLNIATRKADNGGQNKPQKEQPKAPEGVEDWWDDLAATADNGTSALEKAWLASKPEFKQFITKQRGAQWNALKAKAAKVRA